MSFWADLKSMVAGMLPPRRRRPATLGERGERAAARFLKRRGFRVVARGYRNHIGEIDLVAVDRKSNPRTIVFVEVKTRRSDLKGQPVEAVDQRKQQQLTETAMVFLKQHDLLECRFRFDVVGILWPEEPATPEITYFKAAFEPVGCGQMFQ